MQREAGVFPVDERTAWRLARDLARAERFGPTALAERLADAARSLRARGVDGEQAAESALLLLALGLRERGVDHPGVCARLRAYGEGSATRAALEGARLIRLVRPDLDPQRQEILRRRVALVVFLAFAVWGALGVTLLERLG